jgi:predicted RecB family nuclease
MTVEEMVGVTPKIAEKLKSAGITTVQKLAKTADEDLLAIPGLGPKTVDKLKQTAAGTIQELQKALVELMDKENEERRRAKEEEKPLFDEAVHGPEDKKKPRAEKLTEATLFAKAVEEKPAEESDGTSKDAGGEPAGSQEHSHEGDGT